MLPNNQPRRVIERGSLAVGWPPDVAPGEVVRAEHVNRVKYAAAVWPGDVDGGGHDLRGVNGLYAVSIYASSAMQSAGGYFIAGIGAVIGGDGSYIGPSVNVSGWVTSRSGVNVTNPAGVSQAALFSDGLIRGRSFQILRASDEAFMAGIDAAGVCTAIGGFNSGGPFKMNGGEIINGQQIFVGAGGVNTAGDVAARTCWLYPTAGNPFPIAIRSQSAAAWDWAINSLGDLYSETGRPITTTGDITSNSLVVLSGGVFRAGIDASGSCNAAAYVVGGVGPGADGVFTSADGKTITVAKGIIVAITAAELRPGEEPGPELTPL